LTHLVTSPLSIDALQNDQSLPGASDIRIQRGLRCAIFAFRLRHDRREDRVTLDEVVKINIRG
jgi:hypothetical protein